MTQNGQWHDGMTGALFKRRGVSAAGFLSAWAWLGLRFLGQETARRFGDGRAIPPGGRNLGPWIAKCVGAPWRPEQSDGSYHV